MSETRATQEIMTHAGASAEIARLTAEVERLTGENGALRTAFRVNMLRFGSTHKEVDDVIRAALTPEGQSGGNDTAPEAGREER